METNNGLRVRDELIYSLGGRVFKELELIITYYEARVGNVPEVADIYYNAVPVGHLNVGRLSAEISRRKKKQT